MSSPTSSHPRGSRRSRGAVLVVVALGVVAAGGAGVLALTDQDRPPEDAPPRATTPRATLPGVSPEERLSWAPPELEDPEVIRITEDDSSLTLEDDQDYLLVLPEDEPLVVAGGLTVDGGRNVVLVGGEIRVPDGYDDGLDRRALYLKEQTGTVHVEGVRMSGPLSEGINLGQPDGATVQLQNIVVEHVTGERDGHHADLLQTWAGPERLRVDGLSGSTDYQGVFLDPMDFSDEEPEEFDLRRLRVAGVDRHGYMLWGPEDADYLEVSDSEVTLERDRGRSLAFMPEEEWDGVDVVDELSGGMPAGEPGVGYVTPGYASAP
ncbi:hypothetical protein [uncultured Pseudokineococcus sp.]|uniref:hypothetical protein n=1 Tax=uncultured Pseudokineococcus sp. TaxID=1642928 RepID=UPI0026358285|nr:hypothetical protein [uncultured Pseudokineococcus sp.]